MEYLIAYGGLCLNHRPLSKARITGEKEGNSPGFSDFLANRFLMPMFPFSVIALRRAAVVQSIASNTGKSSPTISAKPVRIAASQPRILADEQPSLLTRILMMESGSLSRQMKS